MQIECSYAWTHAQGKSKCSIKWVPCLNCSVRTCSLMPAISSKLFIWLETLNSLCSFCLCTMRHLQMLFKFHNLLIAFETTLQTCQTSHVVCWFFFKKCHSLVKVCTNRPESNSQGHLLATHLWWIWEAVGSKFLYELEW